MTKTNIRRLIFALLVTASFVSFIFINTVSIPTTDAKPQEFSEEMTEEEREDQSEISLPDVEMVKKIIQQSKRILPIS